MIYLLTAHGTLLGRAESGRPGADTADGATLTHADLRTIPDPAALVGFEQPVASLRQDHAGFVEGTVPPPVAIADGPFAGCVVRPDPQRNLVTITRDGRHLSAGPSGGATNWTDAAPDNWERFLPIAAQELGQLVHLFGSTWIRRSTRAIHRGAEMRIDPGNLLVSGELSLPLADNLPFEDRFDQFRVLAFHQGWRIEELRLYRPLVYYAAYNSPAVHAQLFHSIRSLLEFGRYDGHVHVLTDLDHDALCRETRLPRDRASVQKLAPDDFVGYVASKYSILEHEPAWQFQPVCYLDPDIVINAPLRPMLIEMAIADRLTAPVESVGPMRTWPSVGASLIQKDGHDPRYADGFNAGTLGIPNLRAGAATLRMIRRLIANLLRIEGRDHLEWVDQEVANYVSFRHAHVDTASLNRFVRYGGAGDAEVPGALTGLVHFWATGKHDRHEIMRRYIDVLHAHDGSGHRLG